MSLFLSPLRDNRLTVVGHVSDTELAAYNDCLRRLSHDRAIVSTLPPVAANVSPRSGRRSDVRV